MTISAICIARPVATLLLSIGLLLAGIVAGCWLPVAALPNVDFPTIVVFAARPGADPDTMANAVAAPLERRMGEIPGVTDLVSISAAGSTSVIVSFDLDRGMDSAAHDVQAAINAAAADLPPDLPTRPFYRKYNPAETPVLRLAVSSDSLPADRLFDAADSILAQRLSQVDGVAQVQVSGSEKSAVRIQLDPVRLAAAGLSAQSVYDVVRAANVLQPLGGFQGPDRAEAIGIDGQLTRAADYAPVIVKTAKGSAMRLSDVASVIEASANTRLAAWNGTRPAVLLAVSKAAGANAIQTADRIRALLPLLKRWLPPDVDVRIVADRTTTIRASLADIGFTMLITIALVLLVLLLFLRRLVPTLAAAVTVPLSLAGTLPGMWLMGYALDNFSLLALTVGVGFVVDDAIVMIETIARHRESGLPPLQAALAGSRRIGFTVVSISVSLVAVFIPLIFMNGVLGALLHEFAMTLTMAIGVSAMVSLTLTPMICGRWMAAARPAGAFWGRIDRAIGRVLAGTEGAYATTLDWALAHRGLMLLVAALVAGLTVYMYTLLPKGVLPVQDTGIVNGATVADIDISFQAMAERQKQVVAVLLTDPAVATVTSWVGIGAGWDAMNRGQIGIGLKPLAERGVSADAVIERLRGKLAQVRGIQAYLYPAQELRGGGGSEAGSQFQFVLSSDDVGEMRDWAERLLDKLRATPGLVDVDSDQDRPAPRINLAIDRDAAARLGVRVGDIDDALNDAFAQRQISTIHGPRNQYQVILEADPRMQADPTTLDRVYLAGASGAAVPLSAVAAFRYGFAPVRVRHVNQFPAATISFGLPRGTSLEKAEAIVRAAVLSLRMPEHVHTAFIGNAALLGWWAAAQPLLIAAALVSMYIVLGVLYESLLLPLTIVSALPPAGLGALLALWLTGSDLSLMGIIGIMLLLGIVKKNAIMMVDFAQRAERRDGLSPFDAIRSACLARFRPIAMTTVAALLGAVPLALAFGTGAELRRPLGISVVGGLIVSQVLTLYTTPAVYLALARWQTRLALPQHQPADGDPNR